MQQNLITEILSKNVIPNAYIKILDVYSMELLIDDSQIIQRLINGELLLEFLNCNESYRSIIYKTSSKKTKQYYDSTFETLNTSMKKILIENHFQPLLPRSQ